ncbi:hypothetical protein DMENIID0001_139630 [Sergentomyia squamirostris]
MIIVSGHLYREILQKIKNFPGLTIECLHYIHNIYPQFSTRTLWSILSWEHRERLPDILKDMEQSCPELLNEYDQRVDNYPDCDFAMTVMAAQRRYSPFLLAKMLLKAKLKTSSGKINEILSSPGLIQDAILRKNVEKCILLDNLEGPVADEYRDQIGIFFEKMLFDILKRAGIDYNTEKELRRLGFRKTPDTRLLTKCFYKGRKINWIESKAFFGNHFNHNQMLHKQLIPYSQDFGPGLVIYWMGFVEEILDNQAHRNSIFVRCDFPSPAELKIRQ